MGAFSEDKILKNPVTLPIVRAAGSQCVSCVWESVQGAWCGGGRGALPQSKSEPAQFEPLSKSRNQTEGMKRLIFWELA